MRSDVAQPFLLAAKGVLEQEIGGDIGRGQISVEKGDFAAGEVTAVVGVTGALSGAVTYRMYGATAPAVGCPKLGPTFAHPHERARSGCATTR